MKPSGEKLVRANRHIEERVPQRISIGAPALTSLDKYIVIFDHSASHEYLSRSEEKNEKERYFGDFWVS
jgi:hypothetical protein